MPPAGTTPKRKLISLVGFMGCGKTSIGRLLASHLAWRFVDLDERIEEHAGLCITAIFNRLGEPAFRNIEHELLLQVLGEVAEQGQPTVLALGGGTFAQPRNVELLREFGALERSTGASGNAPGASGGGLAGVVIWLDCPIELLLARCVTMTDRPLFRDEASFRQLYAQRLPFYQQADYRVESDADPRRIVEQILALGALDRALGVADASTGKVNA